MVDGRLLRILLLSAGFLTFTANFFFQLPMRECNTNNKVFPWVKNKLELGTEVEEVKFSSQVQDEMDSLKVRDDNHLDKAVPTKENLVLNIEVYSSRINVSVTVNNKKIFSANHVNYIGINVVVLNQKTGARMASRNFDTLDSVQDSEDLIKFVAEINAGRILCFIVKDEASNRLQNSTRNYFTKLGSHFINRLKWRDMWAFVIQKKQAGSRVLAESFQKCEKKQFTWASPVDLVTTFMTEEETVHCDWGDSETSRRRRKFCSLYEGYPGVCRCSSQCDINMDPPAFPDGSRLHLPVAVMVGNRPHYFFRMLTSLQNVIGLDVSMVTVYIDGFYNESASVAELFGVNAVQHEPVSSLNGRIAQHYKRSLSSSFDNNPEAQYMVILEEDLEISVDILSFFQQLLPVLEKDESLFCISAWNDQGYKHSAIDPSMTYRIETMPGLGWVLSRKIYKGELEKKWPGPHVLFDWDMWMRDDDRLKGRECIIPDLSRTYHFGGKGLNVGMFFQTAYFQERAFNTKPNVKLNNVDVLLKDNYEKEIHRLIRKATLLDHTKTPCSDVKNFVPNTKGKTYLFYITMKNKKDYQTGRNVARCFRIWDLDARGFHNSMFRLWYKKNHIIWIGCPASKYCSFKPDNIVPIDMPKIERRPKEEEV